MMRWRWEEPEDGGRSKVEVGLAKGALGEAKKREDGRKTDIEKRRRPHTMDPLWQGHTQTSCKGLHQYQ